MLKINRDTLVQAPLRLKLKWNTSWLKIKYLGFQEKDTKHKSQKIIDANNNFVLPGGIDAHCHIDQPMKDGSVMADNFETGSLSAAFGGTTTIIPFACQYKGESLREVIKDYHQRAENKSYIDYAFHTIISDVNKKVLGQELPAIIKDG